MTDLDASAMSARLAAFDSDRRPRRHPERKTMAEPMVARSASAGQRIAEIHARQAGDPRGTIGAPLPMLTLAEARAKVKANTARVRDAFRAASE